MLTCTTLQSCISSHSYTLTQSQCVARRVPELCKAYTPGKTDQDISARLARLENIIEMALPHFCSPGTSGYAEQNRRSGSDGDDDVQSQNGDASDPGGGTFRHGKWYGNSASGSLATASVLEQVRFRSQRCEAHISYDIISLPKSNLVDINVPTLVTPTMHLIATQPRRCILSMPCLQT